MKTSVLLNALYGPRCETQQEYTDFLVDRSKTLSKFPADKISAVLQHKVPEQFIMTPIIKRQFLAG